MEQSTFPILRNVSLERLVNDALGEIERLGYTCGIRHQHRTPTEGSSGLTRLRPTLLRDSGPVLYDLAFLDVFPLDGRLQTLQIQAQRLLRQNIDRTKMGDVQNTRAG